MELSTTEEAYLRWLDAGKPDLNRKLPPRLVELGLVHVEEGEPVPTWDGSRLAEEFREAPDDEIGGRAG